MKIRQLLLNPVYQRISAALLIGLGILLLVIGAQKEITLVVNGHARQVSTFAWTVKGVLKSEDLSLTGEDRLYPAADSWLWGGETLYLQVSSAIEVNAEGRSVTLRSAEGRPANILLDAGYTLYPKDRIFVDGSLLSTDSLLDAGEDHVIELRRATPITVITESGRSQFLSDGDTLREAFDKEAWEIFEADQLSRPLDTPLNGKPISVELIRAEPLLVQLADRSITIHTAEDTVGAALAGAGMALQGLDYSIPAEGALLPENGQVQIVRVREEVLLNQEEIQFSSEYQSDDSLELDQLSIISGGEFGISAQRVRITYEDELEVDRELEKEWVLREPSPRVIGYGTQINIRTASTPDGTITYWRKITAYATSYNENCEGCKTYTASGADLKQGVIAVRLEWYRYMQGMKVYIPGYGFASIEDVGGGVPWSVNWVDLGYKAKNYVPWSQNVEVYFLAPTPPPENIMYVLY